jgi:hypothetical protein
MWIAGSTAMPDRVANAPHGTIGSTNQVLADNPPRRLPWSDIVGLRTGNVARFCLQPNSTVDFSFAIPTPVLIADVRAQLERVFVFWRTLPPRGGIAAALQFITVSDGLTPLFRTSMSASGDFSTSIDWTGGNNVFNIPSAHLVLFGISVIATFQAASTECDVLFSAAGADFLYSP